MKRRIQAMSNRTAGAWDAQAEGGLLGSVVETLAHSLQLTPACEARKRMGDSGCRQVAKVRERPIALAACAHPLRDARSGAIGTGSPSSSFSLRHSASLAYVASFFAIELAK